MVDQAALKNYQVYTSPKSHGNYCKGQKNRMREEERPCLRGFLCTLNRVSNSSTCPSSKRADSPENLSPKSQRSAEQDLQGDGREWLREFYTASHRTPGRPYHCHQGWRTNRAGPRHQGKAPEERLSGGNTQAEEKPWLLALSTVQAPMHTHSRLLLGKKNWLKIGLRYPHCPEQLALPLPSPRKKGLPYWAFSRLTCRDQNQCVWNCRTDHLEGPASGNKHHPGSSLHSPKSASGHW